MALPRTGGGVVPGLGVLLYAVIDGATPSNRTQPAVAAIGLR